MFYIGMTIGHDASLALAEMSGKVIFAAGEERFSRLKGHLGSPFLAFEYAKHKFELTPADLSNSIVTIGTNFSKRDRWLLYMLLNRSHQKNYDIFNNGLPPGLLKSQIRDSSKCNLTNEEMVARAFGFSSKNVFFLNHHDCHASSAFWPSFSTKSAVMTLDGSGDRESGTITVMSRDGEKRDVYRIPERFSLGHLYSEVTKRYGFKESRHEGKITGLAAYAHDFSDAKEFQNLMSCKNGQLRFSKRYLLDPRNRDRLELWKNPNHRKAFQHAVSKMESHTESFPQLARSIQVFLESIVHQLLHESKVLSEVNSIAVAGGVFSNVSLNRSIRDSFPLHNLYVFPNMGDGGLSVGSIWEYMRINRINITKDCMDDMYLGGSLSQSTSIVKRFQVTPERLAKSILEERIVGVVFGEMEFGPRALCHRSIIASPRRKDINVTLNARLNRTEFMPFAPVVRDVDFTKVFEVGGKHRVDKANADLKNFSFMTETCLVRNYWVNKLPAIVHEDETARPQVLKREDNPLIYDTLGILAEQHEIPVLINTSFNAHEEPIILDEDQAINELKNGRIDLLISGFSEIVLVD